MTHIILVRHGHVEGIRPERFRGRTNIPLSVLGRRQAEITARSIAARWKIVAVYTSPLERCQETGRLIGEAAGIVSHLLDGLNDLDYGEWRWKTHEEVRAATPDLLHQWFVSPDLFRFPRGESLQELAARAASVLQLIQSYAHERVVMVSHDSVNRALLMQAMALPLASYWRIAQSPCAISEVEIEGERACVTRLNDTSHLGRPVSRAEARH